MNYETKRNVFVNLAKDVKINDYFDEEYPKSREDIEKEYKENIHNYDAALPDDLPVIPQAVGDVIVKLKHKKFKFSLSGAMSYAAVVYLPGWMTLKHEEDFARAWVLGVWRVEETGEIVKLEAEK